jgi:hypothetical protein
LRAVDADFVRQQYDNEHERQDKIVNGLSVPIGVLTALGGLIGVLVQGFSNQIVWLNWIFYTLIAVDAAVLGGALYFLIRCYFGQTYEYLPRLSELDAYYGGLVAYYVGQGQTEDDANKEFRRYIEQKMILAETRNGRSNDEKMAFRYRGNWSIVGVLVLTVLAGIPYSVDVNLRRATIPQVHVDNISELGREIRNDKTAGSAPAAAPAGAGQPNDQRGVAPNAVAASPGTRTPAVVPARPAVTTP